MVFADDWMKWNHFYDNLCYHFQSLFTYMCVLSLYM